MKTYQLLFDFYPDHIEYGLALADVQTRGMRPEAALATLDKMVTALAQERDDPRIDLARAEAWESAGNHQKAVDAATAARQKAHARGFELLVARADAQAADSYRRLRQCDKVIAIAVQARPILLRVKSNQSLPMLDNALGYCLHEHGDYAGTLRVFDDQIRACEATGNRRCLASALNNSNATLVFEGHFDEALRRNERAAAIFREINDPSRLTLTLSNRAGILLDLGRVAEALPLAEEAVSIQRSLSGQMYLIEALHALTCVLDSVGDLARARRAYEEGRALAHARGLPQLEARAFDIGGLVLLHQGEVELARQATAEAARLYRSVGDPFEGLLMDIFQSAIEYEDGKLASGEARVRAAIAGLEKMPRDESNDSEIGWGLQVLADILVARGQVSEAKKAMERARPLLRAQRPLRSRGETTLREARIEAAQGHVEEARQMVARVYADAHATGLASLELQARLAQLELLAATPEGKTGASHRTLARGLRDDAAKLGFGLIERRASAMLR
jgi:tetratricopeptide (TPR) repeat protein